MAPWRHAARRGDLSTDMVPRKQQVELLLLTQAINSRCDRWHRRTRPSFYLLERRYGRRLTVVFQKSTSINDSTSLFRQNASTTGIVLRNARISMFSSASSRKIAVRLLRVSYVAPRIAARCGPVDRLAGGGILRWFGVFCLCAALWRECPTVS